MGHDEEYKMVAASDEASDHLLEQSAPISRSSYRKRNMFASIMVGAIIGAAVMFLFSLLFAPQGYTINKSASAPSAAAEKVEAAPVTVTVTATSTYTKHEGLIPTGGAEQGKVDNSQDSYAIQKQVGVDDAHLMKGPKILDCGNNPVEARAKGCVFDVMMQDWMPAPCYDQKLSDRYLLNGNWTWWADAEATRAIPLDEMRKGEHSVIYVIQDYHRQHCIFAWEKATRAMRNDWPLIEELVSYDHITHCKHSTLSKESEAVSGVRAPTAYVRCALYQDWIGHFPANSANSVEKRDGRDTREAWTLY